MKTTTTIFALSFVLSCASPSVIADGQSPRLDDAPSQVSTSVEGTFAIPIDQVEAWFLQMPLEEALPGTAQVPGVSSTEVLSARFAQQGDRRRVTLDDESSALEEILEAELPHRFRYVVWGYTSDAARYVRYGLGEFRFEARGDTTHVTWTYSLAPRGFVASLLLPGFVHGDYRAFMEAGMSAMKASAERYARDGVVASGRARNHSTR